MTNPNLTSINVIIDRSGSMHGLTADTIGGFNQFLSDQKKAPGEAIFTLCTFADHHELVHDFVKVASVPELNADTYRPAGSTALLDAMGTTINEVGRKLAAMKEEDRPGKVIFLIITDGQENASCTFTKSQIANMVKHQQDVYSWEFVFMGANMDAVSEGVSLGIAARNSVSYDATKGGTHQLYRSISSNTTSYRGQNSSKIDFFGQGNVAPTVPMTTPTVTTTTTTTTVTPPVNPPKTK